MAGRVKGKSALLFIVLAGLADSGRADPGVEKELTMAQRVQQYAPVRLTADLSGLSAAEKKMIPHLIAAAQAMDEIFWLETYGDRDRLLASLSDPAARRLAEINYGPWERLSDNRPFIAAAGPKPPGANFYPADLTKEQFEAHVAAHPEDADAFKSQYTVIRRDERGALRAVPYHEHFKEPTQRAVDAVQAAAALAEDAGFKQYLQARVQALQTDQYRDSDMAWLDAKTSTVDVVIGPIETYEDALFGYKAAHEAYVLVKDREWSQRLSRYAALLPGLQRDLPVPAAYKQETPGSDSDLNAYDVIYYAGDCNAGAKTIAINLPNDEFVQLKKGTRRLQLKNAMRAKFEHILMPIAGMLIASDQRAHVTFDAFFANTMFHEVAHGLGIKNTINGRGSVREALKEQASALEEGKADILGLYMVTRLFEQGELAGGSLLDHYVTFMAGIFRSVRFGASSAHGRANMLRFNFFERHGAFTRDADGTYRVNADNMRTAVEALSAVILKLQGDGDYDGVVTLMNEMGSMGPALQSDLDRLQGANIPVDIVFEQGLKVLGLE